MTGLAPDAQLDEMLALERAPRCVHRLHERRVRALHADARELALERRREPVRIGDDERRAPLTWQEWVDDLALIRLGGGAASAPSTVER